MPVVRSRRYKALLWASYYKYIMSLHRDILQVIHAIEQKQLTYLSDALNQPSSEGECHARASFSLNFFNGVENGANFKFYITNQTDLENDTIRKGISI